MKREDISEVDLGVLRFLTCGSVDDGKSTLIGRLLYDTKTVLTDTIATLERNAQKRGLSALDLSLLTDGLTAEREQGITIDVAYRYFSTPRRKFIIADAPGHEQYSRNMVTAASTADLAILLVDARKGLLPQTRRHATIASLLAVQNLVLAVNKMDLVGWSQPVFDRIVADFAEWTSKQSRAPKLFDAVPMSALEGDMLVDRGEHLHWYSGPTLLELLERTPASTLESTAPLRFPVQWVCRPTQSDFRGYAGRIEAGELAVGDEVIVLPSERRTRVSRISLGEQSLTRAVAGQSVMVTLADELDISRGDLIVNLRNPRPVSSSQFNATVCWLGTLALDPRRNYVLRQATRETRAKVVSVDARLDIHTLEWQPPSEHHIALNDLARLTFKTQHALPIEPYAQRRSIGSFILIDETTNDTVAAGLIG